MPDPIFEHPRLVELYDPLDPDRSDLDAYLAIANKLDACTILDVGCGTGVFCCLLASRGFDAIGVDPAEASLSVARAKPDAQSVRWLLGDATALPPLRVDLATMTGNVAQVFLTDEAWASTLRGVRAALRPGGYFAFETRDPDQQAWLEWTPENTRRHVDLPAVGAVESWCELIEVAHQRVSLRWSFRFDSDGATLTSDSTLRFRERDEVTASLLAMGFEEIDVRDAPDRPGREFVFMARRPA